MKRTVAGKPSKRMPATPVRSSHARDFTTSVILEKTEKAGRPLRRPLLLVGLPGIGFVSKLAADHLVQRLKAEKVATLYSPHFPNQVVAMKNGPLKLFCMKLHVARLQQRDLLILRGDLQPLTVEGQYEVASRVLDYYTARGGRDVIALAGYAVNKHQAKPSVFATSTNRALYDTLLKHGAKPVPQPIPIIGLAGLLPGLARIYGARGACLLAETPGSSIDAKGASTLLEIVGAVMGEAFDLKNLEKRAAAAQRLMNKLEEQQASAVQAPPGVAGTLEKPPKETLRYIT